VGLARSEAGQMLGRVGVDPGLGDAKQH